MQKAFVLSCLSAVLVAACAAPKLMVAPESVQPVGRLAVFVVLPSPDPTTIIGNCFKGLGYFGPTFQKDFAAKAADTFGYNLADVTFTLAYDQYARVPDREPQPTHVLTVVPKELHATKSCDGLGASARFELFERSSSRIVARGSTDMAFDKDARDSADLISLRLLNDLAGTGVKLQRTQPKFTTREGKTRWNPLGGGLI
ncbi:hypothetical protein [Niveibacterium sp. COAC-50]|uniref:hypothetical protein n=1 Tax=Niveibacterium sp. COAC-50 TaxID=2729384 RepID=UPI001552F3AF|nr:hypothetical protein [Niveibacterium sp. COAC-50]